MHREPRDAADSRQNPAVWFVPGGRTIDLRRSAKGIAVTKKSAKIVLLSGGNPRIAKADGQAPVKSYITAMPDWKHDAGRCLDRLNSKTVPDVRKVVRWNTPCYGLAGQGWFLGYQCLTKYVKVSFFRGADLTPMPPGASKQKGVRYPNIYENTTLDEVLLADWIRQASQFPGWEP